MNLLTQYINVYTKSGDSIWRLLDFRDRIKPNDSDILMNKQDIICTLKEGTCHLVNHYFHFVQLIKENAIYHF